MCARLIKNEINHKLRMKMRHFKTALEAPFRSLLLDVLNLVLASSAESFEYWNAVMPLRIARKYGDAVLLGNEQKLGDLKQLIDATQFEHESVDGLFLLLERVLHLTGVQLTPECLDDLRAASNQWLNRGDEPLDETDVFEIGVRIKHSSLVERSLGFFFKAQASFCQHYDLPRAQRFLRQSETAFSDALHSDQNSAELRVQLAEVRMKLFEIASATVGVPMSDLVFNTQANKELAQIQVILFFSFSFFFRKNCFFFSFFLSFGKIDVNFFKKNKK